MQKNPYVYSGPIFQNKNQLVCIRRNKEVTDIISSIRHGDYWTISGPRQIGKTTLLNQIIDELNTFPHIYIDMELSPTDETSFYDWLTELLIERLKQFDIDLQSANKTNYGPELDFYNFLKSLPYPAHMKIILVFDEIEKAPAVDSFLHLWRKVYHERNFHQELQKFSIIIAGSVDLIELTMGPTSPFNISKKLSLSELSEKEALQLINNPMAQLEIPLEPDVADYIFSLTSGHPQLIQHICTLLVDDFQENQHKLSTQRVDNILEILFLSNDTLRTLSTELRINNQLCDLIKRILAGEKISCFSFQEFSLRGPGPIVSRDRICAIRNRIFEMYLQETINSISVKPPVEEDCKLFTKFLLKSYPDNNPIILPNEALLHHLFMDGNTDIEFFRENKKIPNVLLEHKDKLLFYYLGFKRLRASRDGFKDWTKIPFKWEYRLSSSIINNETQTPEWQYFTDALGKVPEEEIRVWIHSLRAKLKQYGLSDIVFSETGRGRGYILKGSFTFEPFF